MSQEIIHTKTTLLSYGALALPLTLAELPLLIYLPAFYAKDVGLNLVAIGLVFTLARLWDGVTDIVIGRCSDRFSTRYGGRKTWVFVGMPLLLIGTWCLFNPPEAAGVGYLSLWLLVFYTALTVVKIPYWSWGTELATSYVGRNRVASFREGSGLVALFVFAAAPVFLLPEDASIQSILSLYTLLVIACAVIAMPPLVLNVPISENAVAPSDRLQLDLRAVINNKPMLIFMGVVLLVTLGIASLSSSAIFLVEIGYGLPNQFLKFIFLQQCVGIVMIPVAFYLANRLGKHNVYRASFSLLCLCFIAAYWIPVGYWWAAASLFLILGVCNTGNHVMLLSIMGDIIDYDMATTGQYRPGIYFSIFNLVLKLGLALGVGFNFVLLDYFSFDPTLAAHTVEDAVNLRWVATLSMVFLVPAFFLIRYYPITKQYHARLRQDIDKNMAYKTNNETIDCTATANL